MLERNTIQHHHNSFNRKLIIMALFVTLVIGQAYLFDNAISMFLLNNITTLLGVGIALTSRYESYPNRIHSAKSNGKYDEYCEEKNKSLVNGPCFQDHINKNPRMSDVNCKQKIEPFVNVCECVAPNASHGLRRETDHLLNLANSARKDGTIVETDAKADVCGQSYEETEIGCAEKLHDDLKSQFQSSFSLHNEGSCFTKLYGDLKNSDINIVEHVAMKKVNCFISGNYHGKESPKSNQNAMQPPITKQEQQNNCMQTSDSSYTKNKQNTSVGIWKDMCIVIGNIYVNIIYLFCYLSRLLYTSGKLREKIVHVLGITREEPEQLNGGNTPEDGSTPVHSPEDVKRETYRLKTFESYPSRINFMEFVKAGFYYLGVEAKVKCFACHNVVENPSRSLDPFLLRNHKRTCEFTRHMSDCGNVPLVGSNHQSGPRLNVSTGSTAQQFVEGSGARPSQPISTLQNPMYQTARVLSPSASVNTPLERPPGNAVPIMRHLADIPNPEHVELIRQLDLCKEVDRVQSFTSAWARNSLPTPHSMAKHGWFYLGNLDRTQCFSCGGVLRNWRLSDDPGAEHARHFSNCAMAQGIESRNVPEENPNHRPPVNFQELTEQERIDLRSMFPCDSPSHPHMRSMPSRTVTFVNWIYTRTTPAMIAEAGFFSLGVRDRVKCFYCNGGLQNWRRNDDPWEQHAKWYPQCEYLLQVRGPEYIHSVVSRYPDLERPQMNNRNQSVASPSNTVERQHPNVNVEMPQPHSPPVPTNPPTQVLMVEQLMQTELASAVLAMGFAEDAVKRVAESQLQTHGQGFTSAESWVDAVIAAEESSSSMNAGTNIPNPTPNIPLEDPSPSPGEQSFDVGDFDDIYTSNHNSERSIDVENSPARLNASNTSSIVTSQDARMAENIQSEEEVADQLRQLQDDRTCKVCLNAQADMVFIPCGHLCCCIECTRALRVCPICRVRIDRAVRTYSSV